VTVSPRELRLVPTSGPSFPVIGLVGASGSGKTTLITRLLPILAGRGLRVAVLKHAHHGFDIDRPGKDSYRAREAGATQVLVASRERWVLMREIPAPAAEPPFSELLARFDPAEVDLVLVEGFARESFPKIEVYRPSHGHPPKCWPHDTDVCAVATDVLLTVAPPVARLDLNQPDAVAAFLLARWPALLPGARAVHAD
jgi:molybdopterin-guanine dinucleotide biosynthesis protein B